MKKSSFYIIGKHAVIGALKNPLRRVVRVFLTEDSKNKINQENQNLNLLKNIKIYYKTKKELDKYTGRDEINHQGFVAEIEHLNKFTIKEFLDQNSKRNNINFAALEDVTDPRNIGSIIRSGASFGIDGIIVKERSFPSESKLMYKAASGALEYINIFEVSNINSTLKNLKEKNFWVYGFDARSKKEFTEVDWKGNNILLFGSEGYGIKKHTEKYSDFLVKIEINQNIESLNISNSAAIVFHHLSYIKKKS